MLLIDEIDKKSIPIKKQKLENKYKEYFGIIDDYVETRFFQELQIALDKEDITEEIARLYSHIEQMNRLTECKIVGKKIDFIVKNSIER